MPILSRLQREVGNLPCYRMQQHRTAHELPCRKLGLDKPEPSWIGIKLLVYFELCDDMVSAIAREKALKGITRAKKFALIEAANPDWEDLVMKLELLKP